MNNITVKANQLIAYTQSMIRYAVYNHPSDVIALLQANGIAVPNNVDPITLHTMTLKAMGSSESFKNGLQQLLHAIAMEGQYAKYKKSGNFSSADGTTCVSTCCQSWAQQTFNPKTVDTLLTSGLSLLNANLKQGGDAAIKTAVANPPMPPVVAKSNVSTVVVFSLIAVVGVGGYIYWKRKHKK